MSEQDGRRTNQANSGEYQEDIAEFGDITLLNVYRSLKSKKEQNQRERERLNQKDRKLDEKMAMVRTEADRRDEINIRSKDADKEQ